MKRLIEEWIDVCEGRSEKDKSCFLGLFKEHHSLSDLKKIFHFFPYADELIRRSIDVLKMGNLEGYVYLVPNSTEDKNLVLEHASYWLTEQKMFFEKINNYEFVGICNSVEVKFVDKEFLRKYHSADIPSRWFFDCISDEVRASRVVKDRKIYYLYEALYGISADYYLSYYIMQPLIELDINFEHYFNFWKIGGVGVITEGNYFVSSR